MRILNRYIGTTFLVNFVILFAVLVLLFVLIDFIVDMEPFVEGGVFRATSWRVESLAAQQGIPEDTLAGLVFDRASPETTAQTLGLPDTAAGQALLNAVKPAWYAVVLGTVVTMIDYYWPITLLIYVFFCGLIITAAAGFTFSGMNRNRELVAILSGGISLKRVAVPVILLGFLLSAVNLPIQEFVLPVLSEKITRNKNDLARQQREAASIYYAKDGSGHLLSAARFHEPDGPIEGLTVLERDANGLTQRRITATQAHWDDRRNGWKLTRGYASEPISFDGPLSDLSRDARPIDFFATDLSPTVMMAGNAGFYRQLLPISELMRLQNNQAVPLKSRVGIARTIWSRFSLVVINVLVLLLGLPFFLHRVPRNMLVPSLQAAAMCLGAWAGGILLLQFASVSMPATTAAVLPVVILMLIAAVMVTAIKS